MLVLSRVKEVCFLHPSSIDWLVDLLDLYIASAGIGAYAASKFAIRALTQSTGEGSLTLCMGEGVNLNTSIVFCSVC